MVEITKIKKYLDRVLDSYHFWYGFDTMIHGGAYGADNLAGVWAQQHEIPMEVYPADWKQHGKSAGPIRNKQMLDEGKPDLVIAFPGGSGTQNMIEQANKAGVKVLKVLALVNSTSMTGTNEVSDFRKQR